MSKPCFSYTLVRAHSVLDIWYNKWAGGDREDNYSKYVSPCIGLACILGLGLICPWQQNKIPDTLPHQKRCRLDARKYNRHALLLSLLCPRVLPLWLGVRIPAYAPGP